MSQLKYLGFCGADDGTNIDDMIALSKRMPCIEWGILFHPKKTGTSRYPTQEFVNKLCGKFSANQTLNLAAHLCGDYVIQVLNGDCSFANKLFLNGFNRIQINATTENDVELSRTLSSGLHRTIQETPYLDWIIQSNIQTITLVQEFVGKYPNTSILHDTSCGAGIEITQFPVYQSEPYPSMQGYAGGIGVTNVAYIVNTLNTMYKKTPTHTSQYWIDMETSLRVSNLSVKYPQSIFDINVCRNIVDCLDK